MSYPERTRFLKIRLHDRGEDEETLWAEDLGPSMLHPGARFVRIGNTPVLHAKPTYGDVVEVRPDEDGMLEWDRDGADLAEIGTRILEDCGRWVAYIDYWPSRPNGDLQSALEELNAACEARDVALESLIATKDRGTASLAVPGSMSPDDLVALLESQRASVEFELHEPEDD